MSRVESKGQAQARAIKDAGGVMTHRQILYIIFGLMAGMFLSALDQTIVGTSMRTIADDLKGLDAQAWVTTAYLVTSTIATPIYGKLSDIFGRRPLFIIAIIIFLVGSVAAGFSTSMYELAGFRALQGLGAGGLMALPLAIMGDILAPRERAKCTRATSSPCSASRALSARSSADCSPERPRSSSSPDGAGSS